MSSIPYNSRENLTTKTKREEREREEIKNKATTKKSLEK